MCREVTLNSEVISKSCSGQNVSRIATNWDWHARLKRIVIIQLKTMWGFRNRALVKSDMTVVFAPVFKRHFECTNRFRVEVNHANFVDNNWVIQSQLSAGYFPLVSKPESVEYSSSSKNIRKIDLPSRF